VVGMVLYPYWFNDSFYFEILAGFLWVFQRWFVHHNTRRPIV